jgi:hypothetical protein
MPCRLVDALLYPEDGCNIFLLNVHKDLPDYTAAHSRGK